MSLFQHDNFLLLMHTDRATLPEYCLLGQSKPFPACRQNKWCNHHPSIRYETDVSYGAELKMTHTQIHYYEHGVRARTHARTCAALVGFYISSCCGKIKLFLWFVWNFYSLYLWLFKHPWLVTITIILTKLLHHVQKLLSSFLPVCLTMPFFVYTDFAVGRMLWETWLCKRWIKQTRQNERAEIKVKFNKVSCWGSSKSGYLCGG